MVVVAVLEPSNQHARLGLREAHLNCLVTHTVQTCQRSCMLNLAEGNDWNRTLGDSGPQLDFSAQELERARANIDKRTSIK
jgi:hypothetical protein